MFAGGSLARSAVQIALIVSVSASTPVLRFGWC